jgi:ABC-type multidrug transport system fused ATPase/permease subunit
VVQNGLGTNVSMFMRSFIFITATLAVLFGISWKLTVITLAGILPIVFVYIFYGLYMKKFTKLQQQKKADLGQISEEAISNMRTVKAFACEGHEKRKFAAKNMDCYKIGKKIAGYEAFVSFFTGFAINGAMAGVMYFGAQQVIDGELSVGAISAYLLYMIQLIFNFLIIGMVLGNIFKMFGASDKIIKMMSHVPNVNALGGAVIPNDQVYGELELRNVKFSYPTKDDV